MVNQLPINLATNEQRQQIAQQEAQVAAQQAALAKARRQAELIKARMQPTAQQVRFGQYSGLAGMQKRQQLERTISLTQKKAREALVEPTKQVEANIAIVQKNKEALKQSEKNITNYNKQLEEQQKAQEEAQPEQKVESYPGEFSGITYRQYRHSLTHRPISSGEYSPTKLKDGTWTKGLTQEQFTELRTTGKITMPAQEIGINTSAGMVALDNIKIEQPAEKINPVTGAPYNNVWKEAPTLSQRFQSATKDNIVSGALGFIGSELAGAKERLESALYKKGEIAGVSFKGQFNPFYGSQQTSKLAIESPKALYAVPLLGEGLMIAGGAEKVIREPALQGKAFGAGEAALGVVGLKFRAGAIKQAREIKSAETTFMAVEKPIVDADASIIQVVSKTQVGKKPYYGFTQQVVRDVEVPILGSIRVGASRGLVIAGKERIYPIDIITKRVQPMADAFASKIAGESRIVSRGLIGQPREAIINWQSARVARSQGEGVVASAAIKQLGGGYERARTIGGFKPQQQEGLYSYVGGDVPKKVLTQEGLVLRSKINIRGLIKSKSEESKVEFISGGDDLITIQKGKQVLSEPTKQAITETVATQRATALDIAKSKIIKSQPLTGLSSSILTTQEPSTIVKTRISQKQIDKVKTTPKEIGFTKVEQITKPKVTQEVISDISQISRTTPTTAQISKIDLAQRLNLKEATISKTKVEQKVRQDTSSRNRIMQEGVLKPTIKISPLSSLVKKIKGEKVSSKLSRLYKIFSRRKKKFLQIGEATTKEEAASKLGKYLKTTLAASGFVTEGNKKVLINLGGEYRPAKREAGIIVQKEKYRLGTRSEVSEIMGSKKQKRKSIRWW